MQLWQIKTFWMNALDNLFNQYKETSIHPGLHTIAFYEGTPTFKLLKVA
jgi:hypothetical protein